MNLFADLKSICPPLALPGDAAAEALKAVNQELIALYWVIGRIIVARQQDHSWGRLVVERLANDLQKEFPGIGGFSTSNLWRMRSSYRTYTEEEKLAPLVREIGWSHNIMVMEKCHDAKTDETTPVIHYVSLR